MSAHIPEWAGAQAEFLAPVRFVRNTMLQYWTSCGHWISAGAESGCHRGYIEKRILDIVSGECLSPIVKHFFRPRKRRMGGKALK
jgi:hypothetical protein